jgi:N-acetylglucosamine kinase-like BadF-type ATPase
MGVKTYVAIDGGNSKTHVVVGDTTGRVLSLVRGPGSSPHWLGLAGAMDVLDSMVKEAVDRSGAVPDRVEVYLAGADLPSEVELLCDAVAAKGWAPESTVDNDLFALMRAGTSTVDAIAVVCGAGINCAGRNAEGRTARFPALGEISGDWGGGHHLAQLALWYAARGEDGRGTATALSPAVAAYFGRPTVEDVSIGLHLGELDRELISGLSPLLFQVASAGDPVAAGVIAQQTEEVLALVRVVATRLGLLDKAPAVVLGGGVLAARHPLLHDAVLTGLKSLVPQAEVGIVADPPVAGAALLALDALGGTDPGTEELLRAGIRILTDQ